MTAITCEDFADEAAPVWVFDFTNKRMLWANDAALGFWKAETIEEFLSRDYSSDSRAVRERLWQTVSAIEPGQWSRESWTVFPGGEPVTVLLDARMIPRHDTDAAILFRMIRTLDAQADPEGLRMMLAARSTQVAVSMFDLQGRLVSENPAGLSLRQSSPEWAVRAKDLSQRYDSEARAREIIAAAEQDELVAFEFHLYCHPKSM